jgi:hypothetical protein
MEKFTKVTSRKYVKKSNNAQVAQLGHINQLLEYFPKYIEVNIPASQILTLNTSPVTLLPTLSNTNSYYEINTIILEYRYSNAGFAGGIGFLEIKDSQNQIFAAIDNGILLNSADRVVTITPAPLFNSPTDTLYYLDREVIGAGYYLKAELANPTGAAATGYVTVKIWYKIHTLS